jgi:glycosyltransferase involved in cell wall biosynthesis
MRIAVVSSYHLEVTAPYIKRLQDLHEVDFYVPVNNGDKNVFLFNFDATAFSKTGFLNEEETNNVLGDYKSYFNKLNKLYFFLYPNSGFFSPGLYRHFFQLANFIRNKRYDVVHVIGQFPFLLILQLRNAASLRVHTLHESVPHTGKFPWYEKLLLRSLAKMDVQLIFPSATTKRRFLEYTRADATRSHKVFFGVVENLFTYINPNITERKRSALLFGFVNSYKGVDYLAEAVNIIRKKIPDINVTIAGKWSLPDLKEKLSKEPNFTIIDRSLSNEEMTRLIQESEMIVCPYTSASNSGVIMTAFVFNKPVIASDLDGLAEVIVHKENGMLVKPRDPQSIADAISWLMEHENERQQMKKNIAAFVNSSDFSWDHITRQTVDIYQKNMRPGIHQATKTP